MGKASNEKQALRPVSVLTSDQLLQLRLVGIIGVKMKTAAEIPDV